MQKELNFVPKILLCGEESEFLSRVGRRPFKIVGCVQIFGEVDGQQFDFLQDGRILLDGKLRHINDLLNMIRGGGIGCGLFCLHPTQKFLYFLRPYEINRFSVAKSYYD